MTHYGKEITHSRALDARSLRGLRTRKGIRADISRAEDPDTAANELLALVEERVESVIHSAVAQHPNVTEHIVELISRAANPFIRLEAAASPKAGADTLRELASDPSVYVRRAVGANELTPRDALSELALDEDLEVRRCVFTNISY